MPQSHVAGAAPTPTPATARARRHPWSLADWAWVAGLGVPVAAYAFTTKGYRIGHQSLDVSWTSAVGLVVSDLCMVATVWAAALAATCLADGSRRWWLAAVPVQCLALLYLAAITAAHGYFMSTGTSLDYPMLAFSLARLSDMRDVIASAGSPLRWGGFALSFGAAVALPWVLRSLVARRRGCTGPASRLGLAVALALGAVLTFTALRVRSIHGADLARDPLVNLLLTAPITNEREYRDKLSALQRPHAPSELQPPAADVKRKNVVFVMLESTGAWSTSVYNARMETTPFLRELTRRGLFAERMYALVPHTTKALVAILCGIEPRPALGIAESLENGVPGKCLPKLLAEQGYYTGMFQAAKAEFENRPQLVRNMGFEYFLAGSEMDSTGLERANYFGFEDRIMLAPSERWLKRAARRQPFVAAYLTNTPHHDYKAPKHYGREKFSSNPLKNRYLNSIHYDDNFLRELFNQYERAGLVDNTLFVVLGDHGEGFGEHGRWSHDDVVYEEGLRVPFVIIDPSREVEHRRLQGPFNQLDIVPTVLELLGYSYDPEEYIGRSMLQPPPTRPLFASCYTENKCLVRIQGSLKYIHGFGRMRDEVFDLSVDPRERRNLASEYRAQIPIWRDSVLRWRHDVRAMYRAVTDKAASEYVSHEPPEMDHELSYRFGKAVELVGYSLDKPSVKRGKRIWVTYHFRVLERIPANYTQFVHVYDGKTRKVWNHVPVMKMLPEEHWEPGTYVSDPHKMYVSKKWKSDELAVTVGFEKPGSPRLKVTPGVPTDAAPVVRVPIEANPPPLAKKKEKNRTRPGPGPAGSTR